MKQFCTGLLLLREQNLCGRRRRGIRVMPRFHKNKKRWGHLNLKTGNKNIAGHREGQTVDECGGGGERWAGHAFHSAGTWGIWYGNPQFLSQVASLWTAENVSEHDEEPCGCNEARAKRGNTLPALWNVKWKCKAEAGRLVLSRFISICVGSLKFQRSLYKALHICCKWA